MLRVMYKLYEDMTHIIVMAALCVFVVIYHEVVVDNGRRDRL